MNSTQWFRRAFVGVALVGLVIGVGVPDAGASGPTGANQFANAPLLPPGNGTYSGHTAFATIEPNEPDHAGDPPGATVWWRYRRGTDATIRLSLRGSNFDTILAVYRGSTLASLVEVESNDDADVPGDPLYSRLDFEAEANVTYRIVVGGYGASDPIDHDERRGAYRLRVARL